MRKKMFYGWWVIMSLMPTNLVHAGALFYVFGVFYRPLLEEFGWTRAEVGGGLTIFMLTLGLSSPVIGKITDRFGSRKVIISGALIGGTIFLLLSRIHALWQFYALYFAHGLAFCACGVVPVITAITNWFEKRRGLATGIAMAGISLGAFTVTPVGGFVLMHYGWRATYVFLGLLAWILVIPPVLLVARNKPQDMGLLPNGADSDSSGSRTSPTSEDGFEETYVPLNLGQLARTAPFWFLNIAFFFVYIGIGSVLGHQIAFLTDMGIPITKAAVALGVTGGIGGLGKISFGLFSDRFSPRRVAPINFMLQGVGILILLYAKSMPLVWVYAVVFGFSMGGQLALAPLLIVEFFGIGSFGTLYGVISLASAIGAAMGPVLGGLAYDLLGSYFNAFLGCVAACVVASVLIFTARPRVNA
ncbi:MFS transporter [Thermodesulfobacteriota bacterium]